MVIGSCSIWRRVEQQTSITSFTTTFLIQSCEGLNAVVKYGLNIEMQVSFKYNSGCTLCEYTHFFLPFIDDDHVFVLKNHPLTQLTFVTHTAMQYKCIFICGPWTAFEGDLHLFVHFIETLFYLWMITYMIQQVLLYCLQQHSLVLTHMCLN